VKIRKTGTFKKWLKKLRDERARGRILTRIDRLEDGNPGDWAPIGEGLFEMRIDYGPGYRVYYIGPRPADTGTEIIILLCGGDKTSQQDDIKKAKKIALEPLEEEENGNS
jgi:putative addiction module killer protein